MCTVKTETEGDLMAGDSGGGDWSDASTSQETLAPTTLGRVKEQILPQSFWSKCSPSDKWVKRNKIHTCAAYKRLTSDLKIQTESEWTEKDIASNRNAMKAGAARLRLKIDFETKTLTRHRSMT